MSSHVAAARYGKDNVRVLKVDRDRATGVETVYEMTVCCLLEGDIETSYTQADNSVIVATDSVKNTIFILAKQHPVHPPELFGSIVGSHFINKYAHIHASHVDITLHRWTRMTIDGRPHPHSFLRDGEEKRTVSVDTYRARGTGVDISIRSGIKGLTMLKSTGSQFHGFVRDEYTTLGETWDRILSTDVDASWSWRRFSSVDAVRSVRDKFNATWAAARDITLNWFAKDVSASVQATMYKMADSILAAEELVQEVHYSLPNKHYFELDLSWHKGLQNTGKNAEVYVPQTNPNGLIKCSVARGAGKPKL
ncbi:hypothetical protein KEM52_000205 [Ascosphaera acerosa]|nr:hypothetical protein KEM52_000205 [Ascosphaera acerosa]